MRKLFLFLMAACLWAQNPGVGTFTVDNVTPTTFRLKVDAWGTFTGIRIAYSVAPADCTQPNSGGNPVFIDQYYTFPYVLGSPDRRYIDITGKTPDTTYNVCPQVSPNNSTWYGGVMKQVRTTSLPGGGGANPDRAKEVDTSYPSDFVTRTNIHPYPQAAGCPTLSTDIHSAIQKLNIENAEITIPAGQANACSGRIPIDYVQLPPDVKTVAQSAINADGSLVIAGTSYATNQQIIITGNDGDVNAGIPDGIQLVDNGGGGNQFIADGRLHYLVPKSGATATYFVYDAPYNKGGKRLNLQPNGGNSFNVTPYPRQLKNIFIRTSTPDDQFASPGTALGGLSWASKMGWFVNPASARAPWGNAAYSGIGLLDLAPLVTHIRFVGIAFTTADPADAYTTPDPRAWRKFLYMPPTTQDITVDRCAFFSPSLQQRVYDALEINGINNAVINSYFDKTITYFHSLNSTDLFASGGNSVTLNAGKFTAGVSQTVTTNPITVTFATGPSSGQTRRFSVGFPMTSSSVLQVYVPHGVTGSCTGGTCQFTTQTTDALNAGGCDSTNNAGGTQEWPVDSQGRVAVKMIGCGDIAPNGTVQFVRGADALLSPGTYDQREGCQCVQGAYGPGPITWRNNDTFMGGNEWHMGNDAGYYAVKQDYWIYRNRIGAYWGGLYHFNNPDADGNTYGIRPHKFEMKGGNRITFEGNSISNYQGYSSAEVSVPIALRNEDMGMNNVIFDSNIFQHVAGLFLVADLNLSAPDGWQGPPGGNVLIANNVSWDVNEKGPDTAGIGSQGGISGAGTYSSSLAAHSGHGWLSLGGGMAGSITYRNNTFPDLRGRIPTLFYLPTSFTGGVALKNNFLPVTNSNLAQGLGARGGDNGSPPGCGGSGYNLLTCAFPGAVISGNVILSYSDTASAISTDGWGAGNTVPSSPGNKTAIWPNYTVKDWHNNFDPEMYRQTAYPGVGADISLLKARMGWVENASAWFDASNNLILTWFDHDERGQACTIDYGAPGQLYGTFGRSTLDTGGTRSRRVTIPAVNFAAHTNYDVRINCETMQPVLHAKSN